jgi:amidophosphoribosyltransferase
MRKEFCGIFGVWKNENAAELTYLGLYALQHRGQESAGIVANRKNGISVHRGMGLVSEVFNQDNLNKLKGDVAIGHVRYSTTGSSSLNNIQPLVIQYGGKPIAIAHNGNIPTAARWKKKLEKEGIIFSTETDSELILKMLVREKGSWEEKLKKVLDKLEGSFSLLLQFHDRVIAVRDSFGYRPLAMGTKGNTIFFSSESCAFDIVDADYKRELNPGEMLILDKTGMRSMQLEKQPQQQCIFELIYFSRPDSQVFSQSVYEARLNMGKELAKANKIDGDLVMSVPDSANVQALGYSQESGIPLEFGFIRNHYIGRTFIEPHQKIRDFGVKIKHTPVKQVLEGRKVIVIDDSIVRGTTSRKLVKSIRKAGAKEVHLVISSPPIKNSCYYGIDTPTSKELIANQRKVKEIEKYLGVDSLYYLSIEGLLKACKKMDYCLSCFNGEYTLKNGKRNKK